MLVFEKEEYCQRLLCLPAGSCNISQAVKCAHSAHVDFQAVFNSDNRTKCGAIFTEYTDCVGANCANHEHVLDLKAQFQKGCAELRLRQALGSVVRKKGRPFDLSHLPLFKKSVRDALSLHDLELKLCPSPSVTFSLQAHVTMPRLVSASSRHTRTSLLQ